MTSRVLRAHSGALWPKCDIDNFTNMAKNEPKTELLKKTGSNGLFLEATLSQHTAKYNAGNFSTGNFSGRPEIEAPVGARQVYFRITS